MSPSAACRPVAALVLGTAAAGLAGVLALGAGVRLATRTRIVPAGMLPPVPVALVLGAEVYADGEPSPFLRARLDVALGLYRDGRVERILVSGDGASRFYDETGGMRDYLLRAGVPAERLLSDPAGFDTFDSCRRARDVFGLRRLVVVSQRYHLPRALLACRALGIDAWGVGDESTRASGRTWARGERRELAANVKLAWDLLRHRSTPHPPNAPVPVERQHLGAGVRPERGRSADGEDGTEPSRGRGRIAAMLSLPSLLSDRVLAVAGIDPELRPATRPQFGHYQTNVALRLANAEGRPPREVAARLVEQIDLSDLCEPLEIAGPGFINLRLRADVLASAATRVLTEPGAGIGRAGQPRTVVIDYSSPNVAKQMHVGHLRSTIIGDCFTRVLRAQGHTVVPQNHIGDWGRQFGMLVEQILLEGLDVTSLDLAGAEELYQRANAHLKESEEFAAKARERVVLLQSGDPETRRIWQQLIEVSLVGFNATYARMNVLLTDADLAGESIYNADLPVVAADLADRGIAVIDDGALVVFTEGFSAPAIIRNAQGGFGYTCTDLAAIRHRVGDLHADRIIYVVGAPQAYHFEQVFAVARTAGYLPEAVSTEFVGFGQVLGADGKKFSTREGTAVTLDSLLDAAEQEAAPSIALAAIKYADLSNGLQKDYTFDAGRMVATTGDTGPYLQYAHARVNQILRKAEAEGIGHGEVTVLDEPAEQSVALLLSRFGEVVAQVGETLQPHRLCGYLYELAGALSAFYEQCPVLRSEGEVRTSRLALCAATRRVLATGLDLLGIEAPDRM